MNSKVRKNLLQEYGRSELLDLESIKAKLLNRGYTSIPALMRQKTLQGEVALQARYGFGDHAKMMEASQKIHDSGALDIYTITVDSYTRNLMFSKIAKVRDLHSLNGYPIVSHGVSKTKELIDIANGTLEIRHGSPDPRILGEVSLAAGATGFEGGPISYTIPYSKNFPLEKSFDCWKYLNDLTFNYQTSGIEIERETFGTLSAVMIPPSISIVVNLIEVLQMIESGVRSINISFCQSGSFIQDYATKIILEKWLRIISDHSTKVSPQFYFAFHIWMAPFPKEESNAIALIEHGLQVAKTIGMNKAILKTKVEAHHIPSIDDNIEIAKHAKSFLKDCPAISIPSKHLEEEAYWINREVSDLMSVFFNHSLDTKKSACWMFKNGFLDIPFCPSRETRGQVIPLRDDNNRIRFYSTGKLPFSQPVLRFHKNSLRRRIKARGQPWLNLIQQDIFSWRESVC